MKIQLKHPLTITCFGLVWLFGAQSVSALTLYEVAKLLASDGAAVDQFGVSVSVSGDMAAVGVPFDDDNGGGDSGSAYLYVRSGGVWSEQAKLLPSDGAAFDEFGASVSVNGDTVVVGATRDDDNGNDSGSAYVFDLTGATGVVNEDAKLLPSDGAAFDEFGASVSVNGDTVVVGATRDDDNGNDSGSAYVFDLTGATGVVSEDAKLLPSDGAAFDEFGASVSVNGDTAVVGAPFDDDNGNDSGSAYVFGLTGATGVVSEDAKLLPSDFANDGDRFGLFVSVSGDTAVVGAPFDDDNGNDSGSAYVF